MWNSQEGEAKAAQPGSEGAGLEACRGSLLTSGLSHVTEVACAVPSIFRGGAFNTSFWCQTCFQAVATAFFEDKGRGRLQIWDADRASSVRKLWQQLG